MKPFAITTFFASAAILMAVQTAAQDRAPEGLERHSQQVHGAVVASVSTAASLDPADPRFGKSEGHPVSHKAEPAPLASF